MKLIIIGLLLATGLNLYSSDNYPIAPNIDVLKYEFSIYISDSNDNIKGQALIRVSHKGKSEFVELDLIGTGEDGKGMTVKKVVVDDQEVKWTHIDNRLKILLPVIKEDGASSRIIIDYFGTPGNGLIISKNRYGERTFFADNWPDRARNWIPCVDHPSDKAKVEFLVYAPGHYMVVSNGLKVEETMLADGIKLTHWKEDISIPTKVMVFGAARFASELVGTVGGIDIWTYVFPDDRDNGFLDYSIAIEPFTYFSNQIGSYSYEKLANVQSKTMFGGMENAGCIFYSERSVSGKQQVEGLVAHEIAHQWFGNSVSEEDWHHIWLSEGFATYYTSLYLEHKYGEERLRSSMLSSRNRIIRAIERRPAPIIDTTIINLMELLSTYSYQKGAWVLHMLRNEVGEAKFNSGVSTYYNRFRNQTALSEDFIETMSEVSDHNLDDFFHQWLYRAEIPIVDFSWEYKPRRKEISITIKQMQEGDPFSFNLEIQIEDDEGKRIEKVYVNRNSQNFTFKTNVKPDNIIPDPGVKVLFREQ